MILKNYRFGNFLLNPREATLCKNDTLLKIKSRTFQVLQVLVENAGNVVAKEEFFEKVWRGAFVEDNNLTVAVAEIRKILGETKENKFIETVPKKGYRFVAEVEKIFDEVKFAADEKDFDQNNSAKFIADKDHLEKNSARQSFFAAVSSRKILVFAAVIAVVFLIGAFLRNNVKSNKAEPLRSIAVLPFSTADNSPESRVLAEKLTRDLTENLGRITNARVADYEAFAPFDAPDADLSNLKAELKIDGAVSGEVRTNGAMTEILIKISDLRNGTKFWEKQYSINAPDLPQLQYRIARDAAREIGQNKVPPDALTTVNYEAYQAYLAGRYYLGKRSATDLEKAVQNFKSATVKDASFADAHSAMATAHILQGLDLYASKGLTASRQSFPAAGERAKRALELNSHSDEALSALAFVNYRYEYDWANAEKNFKRAIEINPNNILAHRWYGEFLHKTGRFDAGFAAQKTALALNPNSAQILNELAWGAYLAHRFDEAVSYAESAQNIDKTNAAALYNTSEIYENKSDYAKAFTFWREAMIIEEANRKWITNLEYSYNKDGSRGFIKAKIEWLENLTEKDYVYPTDLAKCYAALGENDKALEWLEKAVEAHVPDILSIKYAPAFDSLRTNARFRTILAKMDF